MNVALRVALTLIMAVIAGVTCIDIFGQSTPWVAVVVAAWVAGWSCNNATAAALCAAMALACLEALVLWRGLGDVAQAATHLATGSLLAAAFALTRGSHADNSASSQAPDNSSERVKPSDEVSDED
jgi:hypothetical protein